MVKNNINVSSLLYVSLNIWTKMLEQTVQTLIKLLLVLGLHCLPFCQQILHITMLTLFLLNTICPVLANSADPDQLASEEAN